MSKPPLLKEPLLHFLLLGFLIFAADHYFRPQADERRTIRIDGGVEASLVNAFKDGRGREPTDEELNRLSRQWLQNEVYYREALALGLDRGDEMFYSRLIMKMREVVMNSIVIPVPTETELRDWFTAYKNGYDTPEVIDFEQFFVSEMAAGSGQAEQLLSTLADTVPEPYSDQIRTYQNRTVEGIAAVFGPAFAEGLNGDKSSRWRVLQSKQGWHAARVLTVRDVVPANFEAVKTVVRSDWEQAWRKNAAVEALKEIRSRYTVVPAGAKRIDVAKLSAGKGTEHAGEAATAIALPRKWTEEQQ